MQNEIDEIKRKGERIILEIIAPTILGLVTIQQSTNALSRLTSQKAEREYSFFVIADTHYYGQTATQRAELERQYTYERLLSFRDTAKSENPNGILNLGDIADGVPESESCSLTQQYIVECEDILKSSNIPVFSALGNHEIRRVGCTKQTSSPLVDLPYPPYCEFDLGELKILAIDSYDIDCLYNVVHGNHFYFFSTPQSWLQEKLSDGKPALIIVHVPLSGQFESHPVYLYNSHRDGASAREFLRNYDNIICVLEGHYHNVACYGYIQDYDAYKWTDGKHTFIGIPCFASQYSPKCFGELTINIDNRTAKVEIRESLQKTFQWNW